MSQVDYHTLINRGRKAGLTTSELYGAMASRRPEGMDPAGRQADCNGFVSSYDQAGHRVYHPINATERS
jgi:hypothetical protein